MRQTAVMFSLILACLVVLDAGVAGLLNWAESRGRLDSIVRYFEYGRSVPGKLERWTTHPEVRGNLYDVAWRSDAVAISRAAFAAEPDDAGPVVRAYGMSFVNNILTAAQTVDPDLTLDLHAGPGAPPNFVFALFEEDAENRRPGDIAVLGILSSSVPALAALSNRSWVFEQPAPFTYPVYLPGPDGLRRIEPRINSAAAQRALADDSEAAAAWNRQIAQHDLFHSPVTFGASVLDRSPFARLVRRSLARQHIEDTKAAILDGSAGYPYAQALQQMIRQFAERARADRQIPVIMLIQSRDPRDADLRAIARPVLEQYDIPYFATADHFDPRQTSGFRPDGHYRHEIDSRFGAHTAKLFDTLTARTR